jgi:TPR repeat protein
MGDYNTAAQCFAGGLGCDIPDWNRRDALQRWSIMEKRRQNLDKAIEVWRLAADDQDVLAFIELAKYYEHHERDIKHAIEWTHSALELVHVSDYTQFEKQQLLSELEHRLNRLERKNALK